MSDVSGASTVVGAGGGDGGDGELGTSGTNVADDDRPMTYEEKRLLSLGINMLVGPDLGNIVKIIKTTQPELAESDSNEFEVDFETLEPVTLRALERFVRSKLPFYDELLQHEEIEDVCDLINLNMGTV